MRHEIDPVHCAATSIAFRPATVADIPALATIEEASFPTDRMTLRNFRYSITRAKAVFLVALVGQRLTGYGLVAFHAGTTAARLSSLAIAPAFRGTGVARPLLTALEGEAALRGCRSIRLEVRRDNGAAIALYTRQGYDLFGTYPDYYEDGMAALRLQKTLLPAAAASNASDPHAFAALAQRSFTDIDRSR